MEYVPENDVLVFGSRASGLNLKSHSDLDLLIKTHSPLPTRKLRKLNEAFEDSTLPFTVDIVESANLSESFKIEILKDAAAIYRASK